MPSLNSVSTGKGNGLSFVWHQAITWANSDLLSIGPSVLQGSKFHSSDRLRWVKMTVGQVEYLQDFWFSHKLHWFYIFQTSEWYIQTSNFTIHLPNGQVHSIWNIEAWNLSEIWIKL